MSGEEGDFPLKAKSPRSIPFIALIQPRQLRCAMNTVMPDMTMASTANSRITYFRVSALRRSIKKKKNTMMGGRGGGGAGGGGRAAAGAGPGGGGGGGGRGRA